MLQSGDQVGTKEMSEGNGSPLPQNKKSSKTEEQFLQFSIKNNLRLPIFLSG